MRRRLLVVLVNIGLLAALLGAGEIAARFAFPCADTPEVVPFVFVPGLGVVHQPNALVRRTNGFDFCVEQHANSQGFLDAEPPAWEAVKGKPRIALIGDSVVEAAQVTLEQKTQTILRANLAAGGVDAHVSAWGISGYGQVTELAMFKRYVLAFHPTVVVLVIIFNDLKNNSWLLQALEDGLSPDTPYYIEIRPTSPDAHDWTVIDPHPTASLQRLPVQPAPTPPAWATWMKAHSVFYGYLLHLTQYNYPRAYALLSGVTPHNPLPEEIRYLSRDPELATLLAGWPPGLEYIEYAFERRPWPPALDLAVKATEHVMDEWVALAKREDFKLVALMRNETEGHEFTQAAVWRRILKERGIPLLSQREFALAHGYHETDEHFLRDGHWSPQGHRWAAAQIAEFLLAHRSDYLTNIEPEAGSTGR